MKSIVSLGVMHGNCSFELDPDGSGEPALLEFDLSVILAAMHYESRFL